MDKKLRLLQLKYSDSKTLSDVIRLLVDKIEASKAKKEN